MEILPLRLGQVFGAKVSETLVNGKEKGKKEKKKRGKKK